MKSEVRISPDGVSHDLEKGDKESHMELWKKKY